MSRFHHYFASNIYDCFLLLSDSRQTRPQAETYVLTLQTAIRLLKLHCEFIYLPVFAKGRFDIEYERTCFFLRAVRTNLC